MYHHHHNHHRYTAWPATALSEHPPRAPSRSIRPRVARGGGGTIAPSRTGGKAGPRRRSLAEAKSTEPPPCPLEKATMTRLFVSFKPLEAKKTTEPPSSSLESSHDAAPRVPRRPNHLGSNQLTAFHLFKKTTRAHPHRLKPPEVKSTDCLPPL